MAGGSHAVNAAQLERWNGKLGQFWINHRERHVIGHQHLVPHLFRAARISPGERVLDIGCGCGDTTIAAALKARSVAGVSSDARLSGEHRASAEGSAVGLDLSGPMLEVAKRLAAQAHVGNVGFIQGDAQLCPVHQNSFDVVISSFGMMFFGDPEAAFTSIAAVLQPRGRLAFMCWRDDTENDFISIPLYAFAAHIRLPTPAGSDLFTDPQQITHLLSSTGWENIQITPVTEPVWMGYGVTDVMNYVCSIPAIASLKDDLDEALAEEVLTTIEEQYADRQHPGGVWVAGAAWLVSACRGLPMPTRISTTCWAEGFPSSGIDCTAPDPAGEPLISLHIYALPLCSETRAHAAYREMSWTTAAPRSA